MEREADGKMTGNLDSDERFAARVVAMLDSSIEALPPHIEARLNSMRSATLARAAGPDVFVRSAGLILSSEEAAEGLPPSVSARLDDIRAQALQRAARQLEQSSHPAGWGVLARLLKPQLGIPVGAFASVCVLVTTLALLTVREPNEVVPVAMNEEGLVLASADDLELYENLEFYQWLADNGL